MNAVVVMRALLMAYAPITSIVGQQVFAGDIPQGATLPAISIREISRIEQLTASLAQPTVLVTARVQVTVHAKSYPDQKALLMAAKLGPGGHTGTISGVAVRSVLRDIVGPDMSDPDAGIYDQSRDFKVAYIEPN